MYICICLCAGLFMWTWVFEATKLSDAQELELQVAIATQYGCWEQISKHQPLSYLSRYQYNNTTKPRYK